MKSKIAAQYFHGEEGYNCAQSVLKAFQQESGMSDETILAAKVAGGGRVEGGICGALIATQVILGEGDDSHRVTREFIKSTGSSLCSDLKKTECGCRGYVAKAAELATQPINKIDKDNTDYLKAREQREQYMLTHCQPMTA